MTYEWHRVILEDAIWDCWEAFLWLMDHFQHSWNTDTDMLLVLVYQVECGRPVLWSETDTNAGEDD